MDEPTLPERLRELAPAVQESSADDPRVALFRDVREALAGAADELERLAGTTRTHAEPREVYLGDTMGDFAAPAGHVFAAIVLPVAEAMRLAGGDPNPSGLGLELDAIGRELAGDAGVAAPMPVPLRVGARFVSPHDPPSPGSFVFAGPALAVWRVLNVEPMPAPEPGEVVGEPRSTHALDLEPVDVHDVPMAARVAEVPFAVVTLEVVDGGMPDAG